MKKFFVCLVLLATIIIPLACGNSNNTPSPTSPLNGGGVALTSTRTPTITPTPGGPTNTPTPTPTIGGITATFTPTWATPTPPVYQHNIGTTAAVNGMVISGTNLAAAEYDSTYGPMLENYTVGSGGTASLSSQSNFLYQGFPTPNSTPPWVPVTVDMAGPQGFVDPGSYASVLDTNGSAATLYYGNSGLAGWTAYGYGFAYEPYDVNAYNDVATGFNSPKGMTADTLGNIYVADTGNHTVEQFNGIGPIHAWQGNAGIGFTNGFTSVAFITPYSVACDSASPANVWVGDNGYNPPVIQEFSSGGTTIINGFSTAAGTVIHGLAINPANGNLYVADAGLNQIEVYSTSPAATAGTLLTIVKDPHEAFEGGAPFEPSCIGFDANGYIWVGDTGNRYLISFH